MKPTKPRYFIVHRWDDPNTPRVQLLTEDQLEPAVGPKRAAAAVADGYWDQDYSPELMDVDVYELGQIKLHFLAVDGPFTKTATTPAAAVEKIEEHIGSLDLDGMVSQDGIVRLDGITARPKNRQAGRPRLVLRVSDLRSFTPEAAEMAGERDHEAEAEMAFDRYLERAAALR